LRISACVIRNMVTRPSSLLFDNETQSLHVECCEERS